MSTWDDKRQELMEEGADEDEIARFEDLYEGDDESHYNPEAEAPYRKEAYRDMLYEVDWHNIMDGKLPEHFIWDTIGAGPYIDEATTTDIETAIGRIFLNRNPYPKNPEPDYGAPPLTEDEILNMKADEESTTDAIKHVVRSPEYLTYLKEIWRKKYQEELERLQESDASDE
ncbi:hypothetical protein [Mitsuokella multacida]|uniref:hypothetical protein n=1 Tax=Mitsuokella multacida TaxID=52226 RepID=UPI00266CF43C|nr:hypothetical protein [Mitsuokella multacida]